MSKSMASEGDADLEVTLDDENVKAWAIDRMAEFHEQLTRFWTRNCARPSERTNLSSAISILPLDIVVASRSHGI